MNHSEFRERLNEYVDRRLPGKERAEISAHLVECRACAAEVKELEYAVSLLRRLPDPELPPGFVHAVMERVRAGEAEPGWLRGLLGFLQPALTVTATAAVAGLAVFAVMRGDLTGSGMPVETSVSQVASSPSPGVAPPALEAFPASQPIDLASANSVNEQVARQMRLERRALDLARQGRPDEVARTLRGAGHPHSAMLASHFEALSDSDSTIQLIVATQAPRPRRGWRR